MTPEEFRRHAHRVADWIADYMESIERYPVRAQTRPGEIADELPPGPPTAPEDMARVLDDFEQVILPGITHWQHPNFFAYFPANASPPSVLAEMLTAGLGVNAMNWETSPAATELETRMMEWLRAAIGLPEGFAGTVHGSASEATLTAVLTARERVLDWAGNAHGLDGAGRLTAYASQEAHSSIDKAIRIAGIGDEGLRKIPLDESGSMDTGALDRAIARDMAAGARPVCIIATLGTTGLGTFDDLRRVGTVARRHKLWLHVDAAWAGAALVLPEQRWMIDGVEQADSFLFNPHKWLLTNFDCTAYFVQDPQALVRTFSILPEYLKSAEEQVINYRDWGIPLGRRFRALKLWFVLRAYGLEGLRSMISSHIEMAQTLADRIEQAEDFELLVPPRLALLVFRYRPKGMGEKSLDALNEALLARLNKSGRAYFTRVRAGGRLAIRVSIGQYWTQDHHVAAAWALIRETARGLRPEV